jgi:hypothetical protein
MNGGEIRLVDIHHQLRQDGIAMNKCETQFSPPHNVKCKRACQTPNSYQLKILARLQHATICLAILVAFSIDVTLHTARAQCGSSGSDDFNDNSQSLTNWGADIYYLTAHPQLTETNGRLEYTTPGDAPHCQVMRPWILTYGSYLSDWEAHVDLNLGDVVLTQNGSHVEMNLMVAQEAYDLSKIDFLYISLDLYRNSSGQVTRDLSVYLWTNGVEVLPRLPELLTSSQNVAVRIAFDSSNKTLTAFYDGDGSANGYQWTPLATNRVDVGGFSWSMNATSRFQIFLGASSERIAVNSSAQVFADNFAMSSAPCYSRFIQTQKGPDGNPALLLEGNGHRFDLEAATNLLTNFASWGAIATLTNNVTGRMDYVDTTGTNHARRFYRAILKEP